MKLLTDGPETKDCEDNKDKHRDDNAELQQLIHCGGIVARVDQPARFHNKEARHKGAGPVHKIFAATLANFGYRGIALTFLLQRDHFLELGEFLIRHLIERRERRRVAHACFSCLLKLPDIPQDIRRDAIIRLQVAWIAREDVTALAGLGVEQAGLNAVEDVDGLDQVADVGFGAVLPERENRSDGENRQ